MPPPARPRGLLFDLEGTLLTQKRWDPAEGAVRLLMLARNALDTSAEIVRQRMAELHAALRVRRVEAGIELPMRARLKILFERLGIAFDTPAAELEWEMWRESLWLLPEPGAVDALVDVMHRELPAGVVTNNPFTGETILRELKIHGLDETLRFVVSSADYGVRKPDPLIFHAAVGRLGVDPAKVWHVGNSSEIDMVGAKAAGLRTVWYNPEGKVLPPSVNPDGEIRSWSDFPALLDRGL